MNSTPGNTVPAPRPAAAGEGEPRPAVFRVRIGRTALALVGALAVLGVVIGGPLALLQIVPAAMPGWALLAAALDVVALRALAVRDRKRRSLARMEAAFREAMNPFAATETEPPRRSNAPVFNAQDTSRQETGNDGGAPPAAPAPLTVDQLREAARAVAAELGDAPTPTWDPVELPKPTYVGAAKARQPVPAPLPVPEVKKPTVRTSIKAAATAPQVTASKTAAPKAAAPKAAANAPAAKLPVATVAPAQAAVAQGALAKGAAGDAGRINLDAVLQRRRA